MSRVIACLILLFTSVTTMASSPGYDFLQINHSYNSLGQTGVIHLPTAGIQPVGSVGVTIGSSGTNEFLSVIATPFSWLEASFYYHRPRDTSFIKKGNYLDKGFNLKLLMFTYKNIGVAAGIDDIAGTGLQSKEYIVSTINTNNFKFTLGIGTGAFSQDNPYKNPISNLETRPTDLFFSQKSYGSEIDFKRFFKGPVGIFGGFEYKPKQYPRLTFKIESNPFDYNQFLAGGVPTIKFAKGRQKNKDINFGIKYEFQNNYSLALSQLYGNGFDLKFAKRFDFSQKRQKVEVNNIKKFSNSSNEKLAFYRDILRNLEKDKLFLQSVELKSSHLKLAIVNNKYNDQIDVLKHSNKVVTELLNFHSLDISKISLVNVHSGIEIDSITATRSPYTPGNIGNLTQNYPQNNSNQYEYEPTFKFPEFYTDIKPSFIYRYADPARFFAGGIDIMFDSEIKFSHNNYLTSSVNYQIWNSFERLRDIPDSPFLPNVRTDYVKYLNNRRNLYINNIQFHHDRKIINNHYLKLTAGYFELMFGGYGVEYLWKPFNSNLSIGINMFKVRQRDFDQRFDFRDYEIVTGHSNIVYFHEKSGVSLDLSLGKYLAGDKGYTIDLSRKFKSGFKMGAYFTRTNISKETYGEGSFDKGFYFEIPLTSMRGTTDILIQPLTRDGGAKLKTTAPLIDEIL